MKCVRCRRDNEPAGTFCRYCGERMPTRPAAGVAARRRLIVIVAAVVAIALVIACVLAYRRYDEARTTRRLLNGVSGTYISAYDPDRYGYTLLTFALDGDGRITGWDSEGGVVHRAVHRIRVRRSKRIRGPMLGYGCPG